MYKELDKLIVEAIANRKSPLYNRMVNEEAKKIAKVTGRPDWRIIDGRLQALRKAGKIIHMTKAENNGSCGWFLAVAVE